PSHTLSRRAAPPPAPPAPRPTSVALRGARAASLRPHTPPSHPAGTYNPLRPRPTPVCCLDTNNSARSAVRLSLSWEKNLFFARRSPPPPSPGPAAVTGTAGKLHTAAVPIHAGCVCGVAQTALIA